MRLRVMHALTTGKAYGAGSVVEGFADAFNAIAPTYCSATESDRFLTGALGPANEATWRGRTVYANPPFTREMVHLAINLGRTTERILLLIPHMMLQEEQLRNSLDRCQYERVVDVEIFYDAPLLFPVEWPSSASPRPLRTVFFYRGPRNDLRSRLIADIRTSVCGGTWNARLRAPPGSRLPMIEGPHWRSAVLLQCLTLRVVQTLVHWDGFQPEIREVQDHRDDVVSFATAWVWAFLLLGPSARLPSATPLTAEFGELCSTVRQLWSGAWGPRGRVLRSASYPFRAPLGDYGSCI